ncbi:MAG: inositol monophosphatase [Bacteroidetes bacterium]|nr:MAG: inositol monophosphatase [Bacteroidota bacterium]
MDSTQLQLLCEQVQAVAREAGNFIINERKAFSTKKVEVKGQNDFVSYVDKESEKLIVSRLKEILPEAGFITEEGTEAKDNNPLKWVIDPLDGTTNFIHGMPFFAVSIALINGKEPLLGVVYEINQDEMFYGWKDGGAYLNSQRIHVSEAATVKDSLLGTGFPYYDYHLLNEYLELFKHLMKHSHGIRRPGSAATDLAYVAAGRFDGFYEYSLSPWDVAAGILLVKEAGGIVTDFSGGDDAIFTKEIIATNPHIHREFSQLLRSFMQ